MLLNWCCSRNIF